jgi:hypothetical protein
MLTFWVIKQILEARGELGGKTRQPGFVDEMDVDHITKMGSVLVAKRCQLHFHERLERHDAIQGCCFRFSDLRRRYGINGSNFLSGKYHANGVAGFCFRPVEKLWTPGCLCPLLLQRIGKSLDSPFLQAYQFLLEFRLLFRPGSPR